MDGTGIFIPGYSVIANDSVQTLGTWIQVIIKDLNGQQCGSWLVRCCCLHYGMDGIPNGGDISYGRLTKIPFPRNTMVSVFEHH